MFHLVYMSTLFRLGCPSHLPLFLPVSSPFVPARLISLCSCSSHLPLFLPVSSPFVPASSFRSPFILFFFLLLSRSLCLLVFIINSPYSPTLFPIFILKGESPRESSEVRRERFRSKAEERYLHGHEPRTDDGAKGSKRPGADARQSYPSPVE